MFQTSFIVISFLSISAFQHFSISAVQHFSISAFEMTTTHVSLEAGEEVDEERVSGRVGHFEDALLGQQRFHLVARDYVALLQRFDRKVFRRVAVLS